MTAMPPKLGRDPLMSIPTDLPSEDGENMESAWHRDQMYILIESLRCRWQDRNDFYCGGNMFIHFSAEQVRNRDFRGPDFYAVTDVDGTREREYWAVWEEEGRYPDVIVELLSPTTEREDRTTKMRIYERTFMTKDYFLYDRETGVLEGYRLSDKFRYRRIVPENGRLWSESLGCWLGPWEGIFLNRTHHWIRMFEPDGTLVRMYGEAAELRADTAELRADTAELRADTAVQRADTAEQRADTAEQRADTAEQRANAETIARQTAEAELTRLKAELERLRNSNPNAK